MTAQETASSMACLISAARAADGVTTTYLPAIVKFLGYCPYDPAWSPGETLTMARQYRGITQEALARLVGVDPGTLARWERNERRPLRLCRKRLDEVLLA
mgnify:CR=1 FL=1